MFPARQVFAPAYESLSLAQWRTLITDNYNVDESAYLTELLELLDHRRNK